MRQSHGVTLKAVEVLSVTADVVRHWQGWLVGCGADALRSTLAPGPAVKGERALAVASQLLRQPVRRRRDAAFVRRAEKRCLTKWKPWFRQQRHPQSAPQCCRHPPRVAGLHILPGMFPPKRPEADLQGPSQAEVLAKQQSIACIVQPRGSRAGLPA